MQLFVARRALLHALFEKYVTLTGEKAVKMRRVVEAKLPLKVGPLDAAFVGHDLLSVRCVCVCVCVCLCVCVCVSLSLSL